MRERLEQLGDVEVELEAELARKWLAVREVLRLTPGSFLPLDRTPAAPLTLRVSGSQIAMAEVAADGARAQVRITRIGANA